MRYLSLSSGDEPIILALASRDYPLVVTVPTSSIEQATEDIVQLICPRPTTPYPRASPIDQSTGDLEQSTSPELQISYKDTPGLTDLYLEPQHVPDHQMAWSSQNIHVDQ